MLWQCSDGNPLKMASNAGGVGKNRDSRPAPAFALMTGEASSAVVTVGLSV